MSHDRTAFYGRPQPRAVRLAVAAAIAACLLGQSAQAQTTPAAGTPPAATPITARLQAQRLEWTVAVPHGRATLRIAREGGAPQDIVLREPLALALQDTPLPDGRYTYELTLAPATAALRREEAPVAPTRPEGPVGAVLSASVTIAGGAFVLPPDVPPRGEAGAAGDNASSASTARTQAITAASASQRMVLKDQVVSDDHIIQGNVCTGLDCTNGETFGNDTLRLKENNLRIGFHDTRAAPFPNSPWTLLTNDSASGGASYLGIADAAASTGTNITSSQVKALWMAGAPANSLYVSPLGRVGIRTAAPVLDLHVLSYNTPALRQEQNGLNGFTPQTWDIAANEANFFVRDVTGGSRLPLRIRPGAPHASLDIAGDGNVGLGTPRPAAPLTLRRSDGTGSLRVDNTTAAASTARVQMELRNNGDIATRLAHGTGTAYWTQLTTASGVSLAPSGSGSPALSVQSNGNLAVAGTLSQGSSRTLKHDITAAPVHAILGEVAQLPVYAWRYLSDLSASLHLGPMAEDVHQRFQLGASPKTLAPSDVAGLAAATVQALHQRLAARDEELLGLAQRLSALEKQAERQQRGGHQ
ncbi:tail fiber domain-containing protein [Acidovorax sp. LjRoot117]|uniref:tail fiber domain-containing protein n=1 Tax=Acidovorax sp. LjRoot117 TaxID=3342255 RepID=UPI003ECDD539